MIEDLARPCVAVLPRSEVRARLGRVDRLDRLCSAFRVGLEWGQSSALDSVAVLGTRAGSETVLLLTLQPADTLTMAYKWSHSHCSTQTAACSMQGH